VIMRLIPGISGLKRFRYLLDICCGSQNGILIRIGQTQ